jgi:hypothetical protein
VVFLEDHLLKHLLGFGFVSFGSKFSRECKFSAALLLIGGFTDNASFNSSAACSTVCTNLFKQRVIGE